MLPCRACSHAACEPTVLSIPGILWSIGDRLGILWSIGALGRGKGVGEVGTAVGEGGTVVGEVGTVLVGERRQAIAWK